MSHLNPTATAAQYGVVLIVSGNEAEGTARRGAASGYASLDASSRVEQVPADPELLALSGLTSAADALPYFTGSGTADVTTLTSFARTLLDDTTAAAARTTLGLAIGTDVQAFGDILDDLNALGAAASDGEFIVATGAGAFAYESGATARTSIGLGTGDSPTFTDLTLTGNLIVQGDHVQIEAEKLHVEDNTILLNQGYTTASAQDSGLVVIEQGTGTSDTVSAWGSSTTITTTGSGTFSANDYVMLTASGVNNGLYRVASHSGTTLTIDTTGDDVNAINTSIDTSEASTGTITGVTVAGFRYDGSAQTWEFAAGASSGPLTYSTIDAGLLTANNTWTGTQDFQDQITTEAVYRDVRTISAGATLDATDHCVYCDTGAGAYTVTLPAATGSGREYRICRIGTNTITIDGDGTETIMGATTIDLDLQWSSVTLVDYGSGTWAVH